MLDVSGRVVATLLGHPPPALSNLLDDGLACDHPSLTSHQFERRNQHRHMKSQQRVYPPNMPVPSLTRPVAHGYDCRGCPPLVIEAENRCLDINALNHIKSISPLQGFFKRKTHVEGSRAERPGLNSSGKQLLTGSRNSTPAKPSNTAPSTGNTSSRDSGKRPAKETVFYRREFFGAWKATCYTKQREARV